MKRLSSPRNPAAAVIDRQPPRAPLVALALVLGLAAWQAAQVAFAQPRRKGYDTEWGFDMKALKTKGLSAPVYAQDGAAGIVVVSDHDAGGGTIFGFKLEGGAGSPKTMGKIKQPEGVAVAPAGFGAYAGETLVLAPTGDAHSAYAVIRIDKSGTASEFVKLPDAGSIDGGKPTEGRDLEFGPPGTPFANKLYAATNGNAAVYEIDAGGHARTFVVMDKPVPMELTSIGFTPAGDPKAPNAMLLGVRPRIQGSARVGRIDMVDASGKVSNDPYLVGFMRPTGFAFAPAGFGSYGGALFIADAGKWAAESDGEPDGTIYRVYKGVARSFATGLVDPSNLRFIGGTMVLCDPAAKGKKGGAIVTIGSML